MLSTLSPGVCSAGKVIREKKKMKCKPVEIEVKYDHGIILNLHHSIGILLLLSMITDILNDTSFRAFVCSRISDVWFLPLA